MKLTSMQSYPETIRCRPTGQCASVLGTMRWKVKVKSLLFKYCFVFSVFFFFFFFCFDLVKKKRLIGRTTKLEKYGQFIAIFIILIICWVS